MAKAIKVRIVFRSNHNLDPRPQNVQHNFELNFNIFLLLPFNFRGTQSLFY